LTDESRGLDSLAGPVTFALLILIGFLAIHSIQPPAAVDENAPATEFSAARAMRDVREIAKKPHPLGSAENDRVREYLVGRLRELGANPEVQTAIAARQSPSGPDTWAVVNNLVAKIPGTQPTGAVLLVAHYDSVPSGPGAGDDASSVAAILEAVRALKAGAVPLRNDLIVLFSEGEEIGLLGAKGFVETFPPLHSVKVVLNFEMRGDYGPSMMFQTSAPDSWLIDQLAAAAPFPYASSAAAAVYKRLPNDTDLTVFLDAGMAGMNFRAAAGGITRYHTALDNADLLDPRTMQHQGSYALSMAHRFGSIDLNAPPTGNHDAVFFVVVGKLIHYSVPIAIALAIVVAMLVFGVIWIGIRDERFSIIGIAAGFGIYALAIAVAVVEARGMWWLMATLAGWRMLPVHTSYGGFYFSVAADALIFGTLWVAYELIGRRFSAQNLGVGALAVWTVLMIASGILMPGASYIFTWPLLFAAIATSYRPRATAYRTAIVTLVAMAPGTVVLAPSFAASADGTILFLVFCGLTGVLIFGLAIPYIDFLTSGRRWIVPGVLGALAFVMIIKGNAASNFDASQPHPDSIFYFQDTDRGRARWVSLDSRPDTFTSQFFQHHVRGGWLPKLVGLATRETPDRNLASISRDFAYLNRGRTIEGDAPLINAAPPELKVLDDSTVAGERNVKMHIASARRSSIVWMSVPVGVSVLGASIDGKSAGDRVTDGWSGWYWRAPANGFDLTLKVATPAPFVVTVIDQTDGLPETPGFSIKPRPPETMPTPFLFFDSTTLVRRTFAIGGERVAGGW
jgi:Peptidase family M28